jgi:replication factor A1
MGPKWRFKARLVKKSERKSWSNERGEGYLLNVEFMDEEGTKIQGTFFKDMVDKFDDILVEGFVYLVSGGTVKASAHKFATVKNEYCVVFEKTTDIV